jgi:hypothetical protein
VKLARPKCVDSQTKALFVFVTNDIAGPSEEVLEPASIPFKLDRGSIPLPTPASVLSRGTECPLKFQIEF